MFEILYFYRSEELGLWTQTCFSSNLALIAYLLRDLGQLRHSLGPGSQVSKMRIVRVPTFNGFGDCDDVENVLTTTPDARHSVNDGQYLHSKLGLLKSERRRTLRGIDI